MDAEHVEGYPHTNETDVNQYSERMLGFLHELETQSNPRSTGDVRIAAYATATSDTVRNNPHFANMIEDLLNGRDDVTPPYAVNLVMRVLQKLLIREYGDANVPEDIRYPHAYDTPMLWEQALERVTTDHTWYFEFVGNITYYNVQSNVAERYKAVKLLLQGLYDKIGPKPKILDVGCSQNLGLKKLYFAGFNAHGAALHFDPIEVVDDDGQVIENDTLIYNWILDRPYEIGKSTGNDIWPIDDPDIKEHARSCTFYPSELLDDSLREQYDLLELLDPPDIGFIGADFANINESEFLASAPTAQYDLITFTTVLYQVSPEERVAMINNAKKLLKPGGLIVIQDFLSVNPDSETDLLFHPNWFEHKYIYTTVVLDPSDPSGKFYELFRWENGRCKRMKVGKDLGSFIMKKAA